MNHPDRWPPVAEVSWDDTHRLIPAAHADTAEPILSALAENAADVADLVSLTAATNPRLMAQADALPAGIHQDELLFGVPHWRIVNASFCHPHPQGSRFNGPHRGAWYAGRQVQTSLAEVAYHKRLELAEIDRWDVVADYQDYLADIHGPLHDLRRVRDRRAAACLDQHSYVHSQALAAELVAAGSLGVVYPAVRDPGREAVACFRPALVANVRRGETYRLSWDGPGTPEISQVAINPRSG